MRKNLLSTFNVMNSFTNYGAKQPKASGRAQHKQSPLQQYLPLSRLQPSFTEIFMAITTFVSNTQASPRNTQ